MAIDLRENNHNVSKYDAEFGSLCRRAKVEATKRQASKFRNKKGTAHAHMRREKTVKKEITV